MVPIEHLGRALAVLREKHHKTQEEVAGSLWKILTAMSCTLIDLEASLRMVNGDAFPIHCQNWKITIHSDEYEVVDKARRSGEELAEPQVNLSKVLEGTPQMSEEAERHFVNMLYTMMQVMRMVDSDSNRPKAD